MPTNSKRTKSQSTKRSETIALPSPPPVDCDYHEGSGIICIVDVERFSTIDTRKRQIDLVRSLWNASQETELVKDANPPAHVNGTGDGLLIAVPFRPHRLEQALKWARDLLHNAQIAQFDKGLRFGLHCGGYSILGGDPGKLAVGTALNECARVCAIGDGGHVIVSESFVEHYAEYKDWPATEGVFEPGGKHNHYTVSTKHGAKVPFRIYRVDNKTPAAPKRLKMVHVATKNIADTLPRVEATFLAALCANKKDKNQELDAGQLDIRICVFEPDHAKEILISQEFRYHKDRQSIQASGAEYSIREEGTGICGRAFCGKKPVVLHGLPLRKLDKQKYDEFHVSLGVSQPSIDRWQRHARALVAFPFAVMDGRAMDTALGVVCIDVMNDSLEWIDRRELEIIATDLMEQYGVLLGALFSLRF